MPGFSAIFHFDKLQRRWLLNSVSLDSPDGFQETRIDDLIIFYKSSSAWGAGELQNVFNSCSEDWSFHRDLIAIALDQRRGILSVLRDPSGRQSLAYSQIGSEVFVASTAFNVAKLLPKTPPFSESALVTFLNYEFLKDPDSLFEGVSFLRRGWEVRWTDASITPRKIQRYSSHTINLTNEKDIDRSRIWESLIMAHKEIQNHPTTLMLSGGIDSVLTAVVAHELNSDDLTAATFRVNGADDETPYAKAVAETLGIRHSVFDVDPYEAVDLFPLVSTLDFPYTSGMLVKSIIDHSDFAGNLFVYSQDTRLHTPHINVFDRIALFSLLHSRYVGEVAEKFFQFAQKLVPGRLGSEIKRRAVFSDPVEYFLRTKFHEKAVRVGRVDILDLLRSELKKNIEEKLSNTTNARSVFNSIVDLNWDWQYTCDITHLTEATLFGGGTAFFPFYDVPLNRLFSELKFDDVARHVRGEAGFGRRTKNVDKPVVRELLKGRIPEWVRMRDKAVSVSNHLILNAVYERYSKNIKRSRFATSKTARSMKLGNLYQLLHQRGSSWHRKDYETVVVLQNLLFVDYVASLLGIE